MTKNITPVLLCGGAGTRLWPLSRKSYPKQFAPLVGQESLFQASARHFSGDEFDAPVVLTAEPFRFLVTEQLNAIHVAPKSILIEPDSRNTAPAVLAAALWLESRSPDTLMLVSPSDHVIPEANQFREAVKTAVPAAERGDLVTFGIVPDRPETGYGYLEVDKSNINTRAETDAVLQLSRFIEKPPADQAQAMVNSGGYLWNAGIFLFSVKAILAAFEAHAPDMLQAVKLAVSRSENDLGFCRLDPTSWADVEDVSIDYAIMEKAKNLAVMPYASAWSDLGSWYEVWRQSQPDERGNVMSDHAVAIDCRDTLLRSENENLELVGLGLEDMMVVAMSDAVLVAKRSDAQRVKEVVKALKQKKVKQAEQFPIDHRPWGWFESLVAGDRFQVKRIVVRPGEALSLQSHHHRSEHWIVVQGTAKVTVDNDVQLLTENESVYIPLGAVHRLENPGKVPMALIEVQTGSYLGEDDIIRYDDVYRRG